MPDGPKSPSRPTMKRLFATSGNLCAFPKCSTPLVDPESGSIVGEICHIKGDKPASPRYDAAQDNHSRHGFDNLILLCNVHHKIVDDSPDRYPVEQLVAMKQEHETRQYGTEAVDEATSEAFATAVINSFGERNEVVQAAHVSGGQVAHTIINNVGNKQFAIPAVLVLVLALGVDQFLLLEEPVSLIPNDPYRLKLRLSGYCHHAPRNETVIQLILEADQKVIASDDIYLGLFSVLETDGPIPGENMP